MTKQEFLAKVNKRYIHLQELQIDKTSFFGGFEAMSPRPHIRSNQVKALMDILLELCEEEKLLDLEACGK